MAQNFDLTQTGPELQERIDQVFPNRDNIAAEGERAQGAEQELEEAKATREELQAETARATEKENNLQTQIDFIADEEDITSVEGHLKFKDRPATNGMGKIILRNNKSFDSQVTEPDTIYVIQYDFDLGGGEITIPENCVLQFEGGSLNNGTIIGQNTFIDTDYINNILYQIVLQGSYKNKSLSLCNFGIILDDDTKDTYNDNLFENYIIPSFENTMVDMFVPYGFVYYNTPLIFNGDFNIKCDGTFVYTGAIVATALSIGKTGDTQAQGKDYKIRLSTTNNIDDYYTQEDDEWVIPENIGLVMTNLMQCNINIDYVNGFAYNVVLKGDGRGFAYNTIYSKLSSGKTYRHLSIVTSNEGWTNENLFIGGRFSTASTAKVKPVSIGIFLGEFGGGRVNNNVFIKPCVEGHGTGIYIGNGRFNTIISPRTEGDTHACVFEDVSGNTNNSVLCGYTANGIEGSNLHYNLGTILNNVVYNSIVKPIAIKDVRVYNDETRRNSSLVQLDGHRLIRNNIDGNILALGCILDTTDIKDYVFSFPKALQIIIMPLDSDNKKVSFSSVADVVTNTNHYRDQYSEVINSRYELKIHNITFASGCTRAFVGFMAVDTDIEDYPTQFKVFTNIKQVSLAYNIFETSLINPYDVSEITGVPSNCFNLEQGYMCNSFVNGSIRQITYRKRISEVEQKILISENSSKIEENFLLGGEEYYVTANRLANKKLYACKTNVFSEQDSILLVDTNLSKYEGYITAPDPVEYPYLYAITSASQATTFTLRHKINGWIESDGAAAGVNRDGETSNRPVGSAIYTGFRYFDITLGKPVYASNINSDGTVTWVDATGAEV